MKASKYLVYVCWGMIAVSFFAVWLLRCEIDIYIQEQLTQEIWVYDYKIRDFYVGLWSNILTGAIVSLITSYVAYGRAKHEIEFSLLLSEQGMCRYFESILCGLYTRDTAHRHDNVCRFRNDFSKLGGYYDTMIAANNDYSPFIKNRKAQIISDAKIQLQKIWVDIVAYQDDCLILSDEQSLQEIICKVQSDVEQSREIIKKQSSKLKSIA